MTVKIKLTIANIQPNQLLQLPTATIPGTVSCLGLLTILPYRPFGRPSSNSVNRYDGNGVLSNDTKPSRGSRRSVAVDTPSSLKLGNCILASAHSQEFLIPTNQASFRSYPPRTLIQAAAFLEQIKLACSLSLEFQDSKMWHLQASHMQTHAVRHQCGRANKWSGFNTAQVGGMQYTTREIGCANQDTCPLHLTIACLHLTRIQS
jgi:hypothetical protein